MTSKLHKGLYLLYHFFSFSIWTQSPSVILNTGCSAFNFFSKAKTIMNTYYPFDFNQTGAPTNFGLKDRLQEKWATEEADKKLSDYSTTYGLDYKNKPRAALVTEHFAPQRAQSSRMHPVNKINKDTNLRSTSILQTPQQIHMRTRNEAVSRSGPAPVSVWSDWIIWDYYKHWLNYMYMYMSM